MKTIAERIETVSIEGRKCFGGVIIMDPEDIDFDSFYSFEVAEDGKTYNFQSIKPTRIDYLGQQAARFEMWIYV